MGEVEKERVGSRRGGEMERWVQGEIRSGWIQGYIRSGWVQGENEKIGLGSKGEVGFRERRREGGDGFREK